MFFPNWRHGGDISCTDNSILRHCLFPVFFRGLDDAQPTNYHSCNDRYRNNFNVYGSLSCLLTVPINAAIFVRAEPRPWSPIPVGGTLELLAAPLAPHFTFRTALEILLAVGFR